MPYLYILRNRATNRIIMVKMSRNKVLWVGPEEKLEKRWVSKEDHRNAYKRMKRKVGRILRKPNRSE